MHIAYGYGVFDRSEVISPYNIFIGSVDAPYKSYLIYIFAFIVVLPHSMSYINDSETGILPVLLTRCGKKKYIISKMAACFIGNVIIIALPFLFNFLLCNLAFPVEGNYTFGAYGLRDYFRLILGTSVGTNTAYPGMPFVRLIVLHPMLYAILYILIYSVASGVFGVFLLSISFVVKRFRPILFLPVYLLIMIGRVMDIYMYNAAEAGYKSYVNYRLTDYLVAYSFYGQSPYFAFGLLFAAVIISLFCVLIGTRADRLILGGVKNSVKTGKKKSA